MRASHLIAAAGGVGSATGNEERGQTMKCIKCSGKRVTSEVVAEVRRSQGMDYHTGRMVERLYQCDRCLGTGTEPEGPPPAGLVIYCGAVLEAPGFTSETFTAALNRARQDATMPMIPARAGVVLVESKRTGERYAVTRQGCSCPAGLSHGYCKHRAAVIAAADLYGIPVCSTHVLGFDPAGHPVTAAERAAQLEEVA